MSEQAGKSSAGLKRNIIHAIVALIAILVVIIVFQNTETVRTRLLFASIEMPRALLLIITLIVGFAVGVVTTLAMLGRRRAGEKES